MKTLLPVISYASPRRSARVVIRKVLLPASGSVTAKQSFSFPVAMAGRNRCFTASEPFRRMQTASIPVRTSSVLAGRPAPDSSSSPRARARSPSPEPPYASGIRLPISPSSASACQSSGGYRRSSCMSRRNSARRGSKRASSSRVAAWISRCSSESSKSRGIAWRAWLPCLPLV